MLVASTSSTEVFRTGVWQLGDRSGWDGNDSRQSLLVWGWHDERSVDDLRDGLYVALDPWSFNLFDLTRED
jgi:hypothetical protein